MRVCVCACMRLHNAALHLKLFTLSPACAAKASVAMAGGRLRRLCTTTPHCNPLSERDCVYACVCVRVCEEVLSKKVLIAATRTQTSDIGPEDCRELAWALQSNITLHSLE
jgi:hypothetical protein